MQMPLFGSEVEAFIDLVLDHFDDLYEIDEYSTLCDALYELYHTETADVVPSKSDQVFNDCMVNLMAYHKRVGGSIKTKNGYYEFHSPHSLVKGPASETDLDYRIYVNASTSNVIVLGRILVSLVCLTGDAIYFKIATTADAVDARKDAIVIYVFGKERAEKIARKIGRITDNKLTPTVPGLTKAIASGVSIAVDPATYHDLVSFGQSRVRPFATAIRCFRDSFAEAGLLDNLSAEHQYGVFARLLTGAFRAHGINPLNPSTSGNVISRAQDGVASAIIVPRMDVMGAKRYAKLYRNP
jgi:hypothetical protein